MRVPESDSETVDNRRIEAFGRRVRELREQRGLSQEQLAEDSGLHRAVIGFIERAEREPGLTNCWRIADGLGITISELLEGVDRRRRSGPPRPRGR
ncbi:MAG: restriction-modification system control element [Frankiales bacterium]|nr:restriction-modification system control element [Frankiales bacterium]